MKCLTNRCSIHTANDIPKVLLQLGTAVMNYQQQCNKRKYDADYDAVMDLYDADYKEYMKQQEEINKKMDNLTMSLYDKIEKGEDVSDNQLAEQMSAILGIDAQDLLEDSAYKSYWNDIFNFDKLEKVNNSESESGKGNLVMTALNDLENFVRNIVENSCKKEVKNEKVDKRDIIRQIMAIAGKHEDNEDVRTIAKLAEKLAYEKSEDSRADNDCKVENEDKRKLIDEIGGILKGKVDDEIIRTIIGKAEKLAYEKSEDGTADNKCKNAKEEEKEEKYEEEKEIAENTEIEVEEEELEEEDAENCGKKVENSYETEEDFENTIAKARKIVYNGNSKAESSYITRADRLELGNNY